MLLRIVVFFSRNLVAAAIICMAVCSSLPSKGLTFWSLVLMFAGVSYVVIPLVEIIRKRKPEVKADGMAFTAVVLFIMASHYYATGSSSLVFFAGIAWVVLNAVLAALLRRGRVSDGVGRRSVMLLLMSALFVILIVSAPFALRGEVSFVRIVVYVCLTVWPLWYFGRLLLTGKDGWKYVVPGDVLMGQALSTGLLVVSFTHFDDIQSELPGSLFLLLLLMAVYVADIIKSSVCNEN